MSGAVAPRVQRRRSARQGNILAVAAECFARRGHDSVRLDEIAEQADIARGTLYSHFPSKEALLVAIVQPALRATVEGLLAIEETDAERIVKAVLGLWTRLFQEFRDALRIAHTLTADMPEALLPDHLRVVARMNQLLLCAEQQGRLRGSAQWASLLVARLGVPLLETFEQIDPTGEAFVLGVSELLLQRKALNRLRAGHTNNRKKTNGPVVRRG